MRPEHKILIDLLNNRFETGELSGLGPVDWSTLIHEAGQHRIAPLIYQKIKQAGDKTAVPEEIVYNLKKKYLANACHNTVLFHQLPDLLERFNDEGIPVILLKGAHLAEYVYNDIALRPMLDIDLLVKENDLSKAVQVAFSAGYDFFFDTEPGKHRTSKAYDYGIMPDFKHFHVLTHKESKSMLEIHCFISSKTSPFDIHVEDLWQRAVPETMNGASVLLLSPEDLLIHLCLHAAYDHLFEFGLGALYDIAITITHYEKTMNWVEICRRSSQWRTSQCLRLSLYFTKKWMGITNIPSEVFENFKIDEMVHVAEERIFKSHQDAPLHQYYLQWRSRKNMADKLRFVLSVLLPPRQFMVNRYLKSKHTTILLGSYILRWIQSFKIMCETAKAALCDDRYASRLKQGDNDLNLRKWLVKP